MKHCLKIAKGAINGSFDNIIRQFQCENLEAFMGRLQKEEDLLQKWIAVENKGLNRKRKNPTNLFK